MSGHSKWAIKRSKAKPMQQEETVQPSYQRNHNHSQNRWRGCYCQSASQVCCQQCRQATCPKKHRGCYFKGTSRLEGVSYEEITFEGYGPGGIAVLIECMTDNRNRTVSEVRHVLTKHGGNLGQTNSVSWMFKNKGLIRVAGDAMAEDQLMEVVLEAGAEDISLDGDEYEIVTTPETYEAVKEALEKINIIPASAELTKIPENTVKVEGENVSKVLKLMDALDDLDDTQHVYANFDISDADMEKLQE